MPLDLSGWHVPPAPCSRRKSLHTLHHILLPLPPRCFSGFPCPSLNPPSSDLTSSLPGRCGSFIVPLPSARPPPVPFHIEWRLSRLLELPTRTIQGLARPPLSLLLAQTNSSSHLEMTRYPAHFDFIFLRLLTFFNLLVKNCQGLRFLPHSQANKVTYHSFMGAGRRSETPGTETKPSGCMSLTFAWGGSPYPSLPGGGGGGGPRWILGAPWAGGSAEEPQA